MTADEFDEHLRTIGGRPMAYPTAEQLEKLRAEIVREREEADTLRQQAETLMRQRLNWELQERYWQWQQWILLGTFVLGVLGIVSRVFWP
jgi:hypothetical protein